MKIETRTSATVKTISLVKGGFSVIRGALSYFKCQKSEHLLIVSMLARDEKNVIIEFYINEHDIISTHDINEKRNSYVIDYKA